MDTFNIGNNQIGVENQTFIIAEAGSNHDGELDTAKELIDTAAEAGADAVKFQTFKADELYVKNSGGVEYIEEERSIYEIIESMEMPYEWIPILYDYCQKRAIEFMSTPFDEDSAEKLSEYVPAWKVASYTSSHIPFLRHLAETDKPVLMSTGAHNMEEISESVEALKNAGANELVLLQCVAAYPTPLSDINVRVVKALREEFDVLTGLSDHTLDPVTAPAAAVALGASVVEKHFTLDRSRDGPDHEFALEPDELQKMILAIRNTEKALGSGKKSVLNVEKELYNKARRGIQATMNIEQGETLSKSNIKVLRPGEKKRGLNPKFYDEILGAVTTTKITKGDGIQWGNIKHQDS